MAAWVKVGNDRTTFWDGVLLVNFDDPAGMTTVAPKASPLNMARIWAPAEVKVECPET